MKKVGNLLRKVLKRLVATPFYLVGYIIFIPVRWRSRRNLSKILPKRILIISLFSGLGNFALLIPLLRTLRNRYSDARISLLVIPSEKEKIFDHTSLVNEIIPYKEKNHNFRRLALFAWRKLRPKRFDFVFHNFLHMWFKISLMSFLTRAPYRFGYNKRLEGFLNTFTFSLNGRDHEVDRNLKLVQPLGIIRKRHPVVAVTEQEKKGAKVFLSKHFPFNHKLLLGIHPGCNAENKTKRWFPERFAEIGDWFIQKYGGKVLLFGGPDEVDVVQKIENLMKMTPITSSNHSLRETIALINECSLFLSNDSGLMHVADAFQISLVAIFGPTSPDKNSPINNRAHILYKNICSKSCHRSPPIVCRFSVPHCLEAVSVNEVKEEIMTLIQNDVNVDEFVDVRK